MANIAINGFGRIGRLVLRAAWNFPELNFTHINETKGGTAAAAHLLKFDSVHGQWGPTVEQKDDTHFTIDNQTLSFTSYPTPSEVPWENLDIDIVLECSGKFRTPASLAPYFKRGVKKVIVAAPAKQDPNNEALNIVMGINDHLYNPEQHHLLTAASCTTNCLAPIIKTINEGIGIRHGLITTIHDITNTQTIVDAPHTDLRRARANSLSLIPTTTGSATAITGIFPELKGKLNGLAVRVPLLNASLVDCVFEVPEPTTVENINNLFKTAAEGPLSHILGYEERPLVSIDYKDDPRSAIVDAPSTMVIDDTQVKVLAWYDNEWGYSSRMAELTQKVARSLK